MYNQRQASHAYHNAYGPMYHQQHPVIHPRQSIPALQPQSQSYFSTPHGANLHYSFSSTPAYNHHQSQIRDSEIEQMKSWSHVVRRNPIPNNHHTAPRVEDKNKTSRFSLRSLGMSEEEAAAALNYLNRAPKLVFSEERMAEEYAIQKAYESQCLSKLEGNSTINDIFPVARAKGEKVMSMAGNINGGAAKRKLQSIMAVDAQSAAKKVKLAFGNNGLLARSFVTGSSPTSKTLQCVSEQEKAQTGVPLDNYLGRKVVRIKGEINASENESKAPTVSEKPQQVEDIELKKSCPKYDENFNPVEPVTNPDHTFKVVSDFGLKVMSEMGYKLGQGLGKQSQGIKTFPRHFGQIGARGIDYNKREFKSGLMECIVCDKVFNTFLPLHAHCVSKKHISKVRKHPNSLVLGCKPCELKFQSQMMLKEHFNLVNHNPKSNEVEEKKPPAKSVVPSSDITSSNSQLTSSKLTCDVCKTFVTGTDQWRLHLVGKRHKKNLRKLTPKQREAFKKAHPLPEPSPASPTTLAPTVVSQSATSCELCGIRNMPPMQCAAHMAGKKHQKAVRLQKELEKVKKLKLSFSKAQEVAKKMGY